MTSDTEIAIFEKIRLLLRRSGLADTPKGTAEELAAYGLDSLAVVLFVVAAEEEFGVRIDPMRATLDDFSSLEAILSVLRESGLEKG